MNSLTDDFWRSLAYVTCGGSKFLSNQCVKKNFQNIATLINDPNFLKKLLSHFLQSYSAPNWKISILEHIYRYML